MDDVVFDAHDLTKLNVNPLKRLAGSDEDYMTDPSKQAKVKALEQEIDKLVYSEGIPLAGQTLRLNRGRDKDCGGGISNPPVNRRIAAK